jgi:glutamate decarboxylase
MAGLHRRVGRGLAERALDVNPLYVGQVPPGGIPRYRLPDRPLPPDTAAAIIRDQLMFDGNARLNLATFCTTWMEPQAKALFADCLDRNIVDRDQYPQTAELESRCVNILDNLWNDPDGQGLGSSTGGSSEAAMLGGLALKFQWRDRRRSVGLPTDRPNLVVGTNVHTCWPKFCRYWDVEMRAVPIDPETLALDPAAVVARCDENTIGAIAVLGSTQLGRYDPVEAIAAALDRFEADAGIDVPMHVDAAVGGFIAPFTEPDRVWDFRLPRVQSINASGHKFGLVYPGVGWIVWSEPDSVPKELIFECNLLGGKMDTFTLNFSRSGAPVVAQYYNFLRLGFEGYRAVQRACLDVATRLADQLAQIPCLQVLSDGSEVPVVVVRLWPGFDRFTVAQLADRLRLRGWQIPAYLLPPAMEDVGVLRFVIRNGFTHEVTDMLVADLRRAIDFLTPRAAAQPAPAAAAMAEISY